MQKLTLIMLPLILIGSIAIHAREKININLDWKYQKGQLSGAETCSFDDTKWQSVNLPHDAMVHSGFAKKGDSRSARNGYLAMGRGWYRRHLQYNSKWDGQRVIIEFEGVYRDAKVYVNGKRCPGDNPNGYLDFEYDITDMLNHGDNVIAVSYDNTYTRSSRWYNGEGINRDVNLHILSPVHVDRYGTYVTTPKISAYKATVAI